MIVGSHVDSVPAGGWLDGALGLFAALEALRSHADGDRPVGLRFVDWADEEGARFGRSLFGSSACAGTLDIDEVRDLKDREGERLEDVVARHDVDLAKVHESGAQLKGARAYLELHIEQGPVLEARDESAAVVLGTVGVERRAAVFSGRAAHAGATPMDMRQDSFLAAARAALLDPRRRARARGRLLHDRRRVQRPGRRDGGRRPHRAAARPAPPRRRRARGDAEGGRRGVRAGGGGVRLHGRAEAPVVDPADPVRRPADRLRHRRRSARTPRSRPARSTTPPRWRG